MYNEFKKSITKKYAIASGKKHMKVTIRWEFSDFGNWHE